MYTIKRVLNLHVECFFRLFVTFIRAIRLNSVILHFNLKNNLYGFN